MAKGFKDDDGKFHPTDRKPSAISSKDIKQGNPDSSVIDSKKADELIKKKGQILPKAYSDEWYKLKNQVEDRFDKDFNDVSLSNLGTVKEDWMDYIIRTETTTKELKDYFGELNLTDQQFKEKHTEDEIEDAKQELEDSKAEIIWGTLFEAKNSFLADKIRDNAEKITNEIGLVVIDISDTDESNNYNTGVFLGSGSAGHDFFEAYWVPLYRLFGWV